MKMTFEVHKYLNIMLSNEPNPTSMDDDDISIESIDQYLQTIINSWQTRHALAREALLRSLESADLLKVIPYRDNISAI